MPEIVNGRFHSIYQQAFRISLHRGEVSTMGTPRRLEELEQATLVKACAPTREETAARIRQLMAKLGAQPVANLFGVSRHAVYKWSKTGRCNGRLVFKIWADVVAPWAGSTLFDISTCGHFAEAPPEWKVPKPKRHITRLRRLKFKA